MQKEDLDLRTQKALSNILKKAPHELTEEDKGFLKARACYLTEKELDMFDSVLNPVKPLDRMNMEELQIKATELGLDASKLKSKADVRALIEQSQPTE